MYTYSNSCNQEIWKDLSSLKDSVKIIRKTALDKRLASQPFFTDLEYLLGALIEMYEPYLKHVVLRLSDRGYAMEISSGFGGKYSEYQTLNGYFSVDYVTRNKLEKTGVKLRECDGIKSLIFWPETANIDDIQKKLMQIADTLPDKGILVTPSESPVAVEFRRKYVPKDPLLQRQRLFERLRYSVQIIILKDIKRRRVKNPKPERIESCLGLFIEELEPQVRQAVLELNRKGYSIDTSGFMSNPCDQMIEGDFQLEDTTIQKLKKVGAIVETNVSGYTKLQFSPNEADTQKIKKRWNEIVSLIPDMNQKAPPSMTRKAREFRMYN